MNSAHQGAGAEAGFTLIELLVVIVIVPLIVGAIAAAIIVSLKNDSGVSNRISDSVNAQLTSEYFVRDIQGASEVTAPTVTETTKLTVTGPFSASSPQMCAPTSQVGAGALLGLYRPQSSSAPALSIAYWTVTAASGPQIIRYSCTLSPTTYQTSGPVAVVVYSAPSLNPVQTSTPYAFDVRTNISPTQFGSAAQQGWTPTSPFTLVSTQATLPNPTGGIIQVAQTTGFTSGYVSVVSSLGVQTVKCTGTPTSTSFMGCSGGSGTISPGASITQANVSGIQIAVTAPASGYHYSLLGSPRTGSSAAAAGGSGGAATLMTLGADGISVQDHQNALQVNGSIMADGGAANCSGQAAGGLTGVTPPLLATGGGSCPGVASAGLVPDPIAPLLPSCFPTLTNSGVPAGQDPALDSNGYHQPGRYFDAISGTLDPGVYELDAGISGPLNLAPNAPPGQGVLLYLPGVGPYPSGCATVTTPQAFQPNVILPPLGTGPLPAVFQGNAEMRNMWLWQDATNKQPIGWAGNSDSGSTCPTGTVEAGNQAGLAYVPSALLTFTGTPQFLTGSLVSEGVNPGGNNSIVATGHSSCST